MKELLPLKKLDKALEYYYVNKEPSVSFIPMQNWIENELGVKLNNEECISIIEALEIDNYVKFIKLKEDIKNVDETGNGWGKTVDVNCPVITIKGEKFLSEGGYINKHKYDSEKEANTVKKLAYDLKISKFQSKTKLVPLFLSVIAIILSIIANWDKVISLWQSAITK